MREDDDRRAVRLAFQIGLEPGELLGAEIAETAALEVDDVDETYEVDAMIVEAVPTRALRALAVALQIGLAALFIDDVVLAGHPVTLDAGLTEHLVGIVELGRLGEMCNVAGVNDEGRLHRHSLHLGDGLTQRAQRIRIGRFVEADVAVAHLQEGESGALRGSGFTDQSHGMRNATTDGPKYPGSRPDHAFQHFAAT